MSFNPYDSGGPIDVVDPSPGARSGDAIVENIQDRLGLNDSGWEFYDIDSWDQLMSSIDDMSSNDLIRWIGLHHNLSKANASVLDTLLTNKINKENVVNERDYNSYKNVMARMKEAGINPALAFRTGENQVSFGASRSGLANQYAREASLEESSKKNVSSTILSAIGAVMGVIGLLIAL